MVNFENFGVVLIKCTSITIIRELKHLMLMYCRTSHVEPLHRVKAVDGTL